MANFVSKFPNFRYQGKIPTLSLHGNKGRCF